MSNEYALRAGKLLLAVKAHVPGRFQKWLAKNVTVSVRQAERYIQLVEHLGELDELKPEWRTMWSPSQALAELARSRTDDVDGEESTERAAAQDDDEEDDNDEPDSETTEDDSDDEEVPDSCAGAAPRVSAEQLREAKVAHRQRVKKLPEFIKSRAIKFGRNSPAMHALQEMGAACRKAALVAARGLHSRELEERGCDVELLAMALLQMLPEKLPVAKLFQPEA